MPLHVVVDVAKFAVFYYNYKFSYKEKTIYLYSVTYYNGFTRIALQISKCSILRWHILVLTRGSEVVVCIESYSEK